MDYILSQKEIDALTPVKRLQNRNEALEEARKIILKVSGFRCVREDGVCFGYCTDCPIWKFGKSEMPHSSGCVSNKEAMDYICIHSKALPK